MLAAFAGGEAAHPDNKLASLAPRGGFASHAVGSYTTDKGAVDGRLETEVDGIVGPQVEGHGGTGIARFGAEDTGVDGVFQCGNPGYDRSEIGARKGFECFCDPHGRRSVIFSRIPPRLPPWRLRPDSGTRPRRSACFGLFRGNLRLSPELTEVLLHRDEPN